MNDTQNFHAVELWKVHDQNFLEAFHPEYAQLPEPGALE